MTITVSFGTFGGIGTVDNPTFKSVRKRETISLTGTTTATSLDGEVVLIQNDETATILVAFGTTPDGQALTETAATSAGIPIGAGGSFVLQPPTGSKINAKTVA